MLQVIDAAARAADPPRVRPSADVRAEAAQQRRLRRDLTMATQHESFILHYQPRVALRTGMAVGAEALLRWPHRKRGLVSPTTFLPLAERSGQISAIGGWALRSACTEAARWPEPTRLSINIAGRQLRDRLLLGHLADALDRSGLSPERLDIELTEAALVDGSEAPGPCVDNLLTLSAIRDLGVGLTLDEFGTGATSLALLRRLPLTALKLDRSLVRDLTDDRECQAIARALIDTAKALGLAVIAEGVDQEAQRACLARLACDEAQGALFGPPLPVERLRERLAVSPARS